MFFQRCSFHIVFLFVLISKYEILSKSCWWSFCQSETWIRQGCHPHHLYFEAKSRPCDRGMMYQCCPIVTTDNTDHSSKSISSDFNSIETAAKESGLCSWYGSGDVPQGAPTASGERFDRHAMKAAHKFLPFGTRIRVINLQTKKTVDVVINDRGPFLHRRILDLTFAAFGAVENRDKGLFHCSYTVLPH